MSVLARNAEIQKLARLLGVAPERLHYLGRLQPEAIRSLRERTAEALYEGDRKLFQRIADASRALPISLCALVAERAFGPLLCARIAGLVSAERAVEMARRLHTGFLADLCAQMDPRTAREVLALMPPQRIAEVAGELVRRGEYVSMGRFVDNLAEAAVHAVVADLDDDAVLLRIGVFIEDVERLGTVVDLLPRGRLLGLIRSCAGAGAELWPEVLWLINRVDEPRRRELAHLAAESGDEVVLGLLSQTHAKSLWTELLPVLAVMHEAPLQRLLGLDYLQQDAVLEALVTAAREQGLWPQLQALIGLMDAPVRERALRLAEAVPAPAVRSPASRGSRGSPRTC